MNHAHHLHRTAQAVITMASMGLRLAFGAADSHSASKKAQKEATAAKAEAASHAGMNMGYAPASPDVRAQGIMYASDPSRDLSPDETASSESVRPVRAGPSSRLPRIAVNNLVDLASMSLDTVHALSADKKPKGQAKTSPLNASIQPLQAALPSPSSVPTAQSSLKALSERPRNGKSRTMRRRRPRKLARPRIITR